VYSATGDVDNYEALLNECNGIPMIVGLNEIQPLSSQLITADQEQNIWFETVNS
jgi:phosphohistidine swiveling domain-containing protein